MLASGFDCMQRIDCSTSRGCCLASDLLAFNGAIGHVWAKKLRERSAYTGLPHGHGQSGATTIWCYMRAHSKTAFALPYSLRKASSTLSRKPSSAKVMAFRMVWMSDNLGAPKLPTDVTKQVGMDRCPRLDPSRVPSELRIAAKMLLGWMLASRIIVPCAALRLRSDILNAQLLAEGLPHEAVALVPAIGRAVGLDEALVIYGERHGPPKCAMTSAAVSNYPAAWRVTERVASNGMARPITTRLHWDRMRIHAAGIYMSDPMSSRVCQERCWRWPQSFAQHDLLR